MNFTFVETKNIKKREKIYSILFIYNKIEYFSRFYSLYFLGFALHLLFNFMQKMFYTILFHRKFFK